MQLQDVFKCSRMVELFVCKLHVARRQFGAIFVLFCFCFINHFSIRLIILMRDSLLLLLRLHCWLTWFVVDFWRTIICRCELKTLYPCFRRLVNRLLWTGRIRCWLASIHLKFHSRFRMYHWIITASSRSWLQLGMVALRSLQRNGVLFGVLCVWLNFSNFNTGFSFCIQFEFSSGIFQCYYRMGFQNRWCSIDCEFIAIWSRAIHNIWYCLFLSRKDHSYFFFSFFFIVVVASCFIGNDDVIFGAVIDIYYSAIDNIIN